MRSLLHPFLAAVIAVNAAPLAWGATFTWEGSADRYWGNTASWSGGTGVPDDNTDTFNFNNDFITASQRTPVLLADAAGNDASFTVAGGSMSAPSSGNRNFVINNVASGTGQLIFHDPSDDVANISHFGPNNVTVNVAVQLLSDLNLASTSTSGTNALALKWAFNGSISESGGARSVTLNASDGRRFDLGGANSYSGGTTVAGGVLRVNAAADLGLGDVAVSGGVLDLLNLDSAIVDDAELSIDGSGIVQLADGVNEIVGSLLFDGVAQAQGTYGSTSSTATFQNDTYFSGTGIVTVIPEPASLALLGMGGLCLLGRRRPE